MNKVIENICTRWSCREYSDQLVREDDLAEIMTAAIYAPSAMNMQKWKFTVITNRDLINDIAKKMGKALGNEQYDLYKPPVLIIPSVPKDLTYGDDDIACALENIFLAAHSKNLASCWINQMRTIIDQPEIREMLTELGIPEDHTVYGMAILGHPANKEHTPVKRVGEVIFLR